MPTNVDWGVQYHWQLLITLVGCRNTYKRKYVYLNY